MANYWVPLKGTVSNCMLQGTCKRLAGQKSGAPNLGKHKLAYKNRLVRGDGRRMRRQNERSLTRYVVHGL